jgi:hypothetical protein
VNRALVVGLILSSTAAFAQQQKTLRIALYAPNAPFASGIDRATFVSRLAQQISSVAGVPAKGDAYARATDLEKAIASKQVDFAVLDGVYLAQKGVPYSCLATATVNGETAPKWALFSANMADVKSLQGKKLSVAATGGRDDDFIGNGLFDGELSTKRFFAPLSKAPDLSSAVSAVSLGKAEAVFAPESMGKGMKSIFEAGRIPNPAFCEVASGIPSDLVGKVKQAVLSHGAQAALDGWKPADTGAYKALYGRLSAKTKRPFMAEPNTLRSEDLDVLAPAAVESAQPDLKSQFWYP